MVFGWQGFQFEHPEDWVPASLTGTRDEGYARLASSGKLSCQIRWKASKKVPSRDSLEAYLRRLERDSRRGKSAFRYEIQDDGAGFTYRYWGNAQGRGRLFLEASRTYFFEIVSTGKDVPSGPFRDCAQTFLGSGNEIDRWSLLGLDARVPSGLSVIKKQFQAGRTKLELKDRRMAVVLDRWGFAEQLVRKHDLESWAKSLLQMPCAEIEEASCGIRLTSPCRLGGRVDEALVLLQPQLNQISLVHVRARNERWRPQWDWLI